MPVWNECFIRHSTCLEFAFLSAFANWRKRTYNLSRSSISVKPDTVARKKGNSETFDEEESQQSRFQPLFPQLSFLSAHSVPVLRRSEPHAHYYALQTEPGPSPEPRVNERPGRGSEDYKTASRKLTAPEINRSNLRIIGEHLVLSIP